MGFTSKSFAVSRLDVSSLPPDPDAVAALLESAAFRPIPEDSEVRTSVGISPMDGVEDPRLAHKVWAFRVRIDTKKAPASAIQLRVAELLDEAKERGEFVGPKKLRTLRNEAEEELHHQAIPSSVFVDCLLEITAEASGDQAVLYVSTTTRARISDVQSVLRRLQWTSILKTPWADEPEPESMFFERQHPGQSLHGCRFLRKLILHPELDELIPASKGGRAVIATINGRRTLQDAVMSDLVHFLNQKAEALVVKLLCDGFNADNEDLDGTLTLSALDFMLTGVRFTSPGPESSVPELLLDRLERVRGLFVLLERLYSALHVKEAA